MKNKLSAYEEIESLRLSLAICGVVADSQTCELIIELVQVMKTKGDKFSVSDAVKIKHAISKIYNRVQVVAEPTKHNP